MYSAQVISAVTFLFLSFLAQIGSEKSLFDELPLNGALVEPSGDSTRYSVSSSQSQDVSWGRRQSRQSQHGHHQQDAIGEPRHDLGESETDLSKSSGLSLFDELPNQGALPPPKSSRNRSTRDSLVSYDVTPVKPSQEFDVPFWDNRLITPIVNSISNSPRPINPSFRLPFSSSSNYGPPRGPPPPQHHHHHGGSYHQNHNTAYGPPPPSPPNFSQPPPHPPKSFSFNYNKHHHHHPPPPRPPPPSREEYKNPKGNHQVTATSGGPTVIVYAHPKKETSPGSSSSSFNPPSSGYPESHAETTDAPVKNEIHYHYHINKGETPTTPIPADESSGGGYSYPAPSSYYRPTNQRRNHKSMGPPRRPPPPPHQHYGPPPNRFKAGGSNPNDLLNDEEDEVNRRTFFSVSSGKKRPADSVSFVGPPSSSYEVPPAPNAPSGSFSDGPSTAYGPPSNNPPDTSYGPPTAPPPPANPPAPPPPQQDSGGDQFETTLTLQTIPVTRTVTELVQVPNVVYKVSSNRPSASNNPGIASLDEPDAPPVHNPPSTAYGAPAPPPPARNRVPQLPNMDSSRVRLASERPFESHLEQILGVSPTQNSRDAVLQELLLGQARNPGSFDLTLSDLELISLLQNSRGGQSGGMLSNTGTQFPILNPGRQSLGSRLFGNGRGMSSAFSSLFGGGGGTGGGLGSILQSGSSSGLTGGGGGSDSLSGLREAFREQRFQLALQDLRKQLREQNKENVRERSGYRSLFTRGALLLSALTLLPSVVSPMASAAGVGSAAASVVPNFMLPVTAAGRRKRDLGFFANGLRESSFETCLRNAHVQGTHKFQYGKWINCASKLSLKDMESLAGNNRERTQGLLYDLRGIENDIRRYIPAKELVEASSCVQRDLCENIVNMKNLPETNSLALLYSLFQGNMGRNRWIQESVSAAVGRNKCQRFPCPSNNYM